MNCSMILCSWMNQGRDESAHSPLFEAEAAYQGIVKDMLQCQGLVVLRNILPGYALLLHLAIVLS